MNRLRGLEELAMVATVAVILATYAVVGTAHGREANPLMGAVLDLAGWPAFAAAKIIVTAGLFALARRAVNLERRGTTQAALAGGGTFALLILLNAGHDLALLAAVWPVSLWWGTSLGYGAAVALLAGLLVARPDPRPLLDEIVSALGEVTSRLSKPDMSAAQSVLLAVLVAITVTAALGLFPVAEYAAAAGTTIDSFEDGDISEWSGDTDGFQTTTEKAQSGSYSMRDDPDWGGSCCVAKLSRTFSDGDTTSAEFYINFNGNIPSNQQVETEWGASGGDTVDVRVEPDGDLTHRQSSGFVDTGLDVPADGWVKIRLEFDDANSEVDALGTTPDGTTTEAENLVPETYPSQIDSIEFLWQADVNIYADTLRTNVQLGQPVSGTLSTADGWAIEGATVELRQSGSVVDSTTTNSSGGYEFSTVSDGNYTVRASTDGYQNSSSDITVAGSPRTVDLTLNEEGTFTREFQLGPDASQMYPPSLSRLELYRFDRAIEFPLPGGTTFEAGPGTWEQVETTNFNSQGAAYARLEDGQPYRVDVIATSGARQTRWESLGWLANASRPDPYGITVGSDDEPTPTPTGTSTGTATGPTATPIGGDVPSPQYPDLTPPSDPFDLDDDGEYFDDPDGSGGNVSAPAGGDGFGPRLVGDCLTADGSSGVLLEYWDPTYSTSSLEYNVSAGENA
jgi:hypothetical protein